METIDEMLKRHKREIKELQDNCEHLKTRRESYIGIPGCSERIKYCLVCGEEFKILSGVIIESTTISNNCSEGRKE